MPNHLKERLVELELRSALWQESAAAQHYLSCGPGSKALRSHYQQTAADQAERARNDLLAALEIHRQLAAQEACRVALQKLLDRYVELAGSGDCGFWDPEDEDEVKAARAALAALEGLGP